jgi:uncharacterized membrane protein
MLEPLLYFGGTILATAIVAVFACRHRVAHEKQISWGTLVASPVIANVVVVASLAFYEEGWHIFSRDAWSEPKGGWAGVVVVMGVVTIFCILPALAVAVYYQRRSKRDEKSMV